MEIKRDVFQAIADPTRRTILSLLALQALTLNAIADNFEISRPAVSKHVKLLEECGLIKITQQGRERICEAKFEKLDEVSQWISKYRQHWEKKFDSMESYIQKLKKQREHDNKRKHR